jgi:hypothetical protein
MISIKDIDGTIGGIRHIGDLLRWDGETPLSPYKEWLATDPETEWERTQRAYHEWIEKTFENKPLDVINEATDTIAEFIKESEQVAFVKGARFGAQMALDLISTRQEATK